MDIWVTLGHIVVLLSASLILGGLFSRFKQSPLVGYLFAGMILGGPGSLDLIQSEHEIEAISELGVALLLFSLGLEFSVNRLKQLGIKPLLGGVIQIVLTIGLAWLAGPLLNLSPTQALAFGMMISLSSTAVVLRILMERTALEMPHGRNSLAVLLTQDMAVVPLALLMTVIGQSGPLEETALQIGQLVLYALGLMIVIYGLSRIAEFALGAMTLHRNRELSIIFAIVAGLGSAWAAHFVGISPALGAFVAGMTLGSSFFATQIRADIAALRVVLLTLFFGAAGMLADPLWIIQHAPYVLTVAAAITLGKLVIILGIFMALGHTLRVSAATGLALAQVGEFAFVLGSIGRVSGVVSDELYALVISVTIVSFVLSAFLVPAAPTFGHWLARIFSSKTAEDPNDSTTNETPFDLLVIGYGPSGQIAVRPVMDMNLRVLVIDLNKVSVQQASNCGFTGAVGDATHPEVLEHYPLSQCKAVVITIPHHDSALAIVELCRHLLPQARVFVRSRYELHYDEFRQAGATVVSDEREVGKGIASLLKQYMTA